ncbi:hypothetical protein E4U43_007078 [Claviceps pusilla]|uniref:Uncharacterized protein n=1 Tax=Claviceps pusilla TaxID=123648 RepID=A0A9P7SYC8_9HYPO|nr:hypothetical protein E4U43_007078 [Claviceps pusilla]
MSPAPKSYSRVAHVEDADEDSGSSIHGKPGTRKYATSGAPINPSKANTSKSRSDKRPVPSRSMSASAVFKESDSRRAAEQKAKETRHHPSDRDCGDPELRAKDREQQRRDRRLREDEKERKTKTKTSAAAATAAPVAARDEARAPRVRRPTELNQSATQPAPSPMYKRGHVDDPASYGLQQPATSGARPRAQMRPASYHVGQPYGPPPVSMMWHPPHPAAVPLPMGAYPPPPMWQGYGTSPRGFGAFPPPSPMGPAPEYFDAMAAQDPHSHLRQRFETRSGAAMGYQKPLQALSSAPPPPSPSTMEYYHSQDYPDDPSSMHPPTLRPSRFRDAEDDRRRMPPPDLVPARPQSAHPPSTSYRPPTLQQRPPSRQGQSRPPVTQRRSVNFVDQPESGDDDFSGEDELFNVSSPMQSSEDRHAAVPRPRRSSIAYNHRNCDVVPAPAARRRRSSTYGSNALASGGVRLDDKKISNALRYQQEQQGVSGKSQVPLTEESLRKAGRRTGGASSHSTPSSASRDDSDYKRSNATGITRTTYNSEDWNIKISGNARVRFPGAGAEIECGDHTEIVFTAPSGGGGSRLGSDKASMFNPRLEDPRSQVERKTLPHRPRAPSQSDSQSRSYADSQASYGFSGVSF